MVGRRWLCETVEAFVTYRKTSVKMLSVRIWQVSRSVKWHLDWGLAWFSPVISCNFRISNLEHNTPSISMSRSLYTYRISNFHVFANLMQKVPRFSFISLFRYCCSFSFFMYLFLSHALFPSPFCCFHLFSLLPLLKKKRRLMKSTCCLSVCPYVCPSVCLCILIFVRRLMRSPRCLCVYVSLKFLVFYAVLVL